MVYMSTPSMHTNNPMSVKFCKPTNAHVEQVEQLFIKTLTGHFPMYTADALSAYRKAWTREKILQKINDQTDFLLCAWDGDNPVGLISGPSPEGGVATIVWLLVDTDYQGKKIGSQLLAQASQYYKSIGCHKLKLTAPSEKARDFYLREGMVQEGFFPSHWWKADFWALGMPL
jgi:GNAT superfamily N-acetyltransferase